MAGELKWFGISCDRVDEYLAARLTLPMVCEECRGHVYQLTDAGHYECVYCPHRPEKP